MTTETPGVTQTMNWVAYAAAGWAFIFAVFHIVWAAGWYVGLDAEKSAKAFAVSWMWWYDIFIAVMCAVAVPIALGFVQPWSHRFPRKILHWLAWIGTSLLAVRSAGSFFQMVRLMVKGKFLHEEARHVAWEFWFYLGALLWGMSVWLFTLRSKKTPGVGHG